MTLSELIAHWPWVIAYIGLASLVFVWLRRSGSTDQQSVRLAEEGSGFGPAASLGAIAAEFFSLSGARLLLLLLVASSAVRIALGSWSLWDGAVLLSIVAFWPLQEWLIHVFLLHCKPMVLFGRHIDLIVSRNHRNHHRNPWEPELGITPTHMIWLYAAGLPAVWCLFLPLPQAFSGVATYFFLALNYEWVHYLIHTSYPPQSWFYKRLWINHRLHHFKNEQYWYGVTMLAGDKLLMTQPDAHDASRSATCLSLGVGSEYGKPENESGNPGQQCRKPDDRKLAA